MTAIDKKGLWERIKGFSLDDIESTFPFSARLARENDWSKAYTQKVIEEYKRFVFLAMTAGHPITPSVSVDQVWHLHLCYTESYWEDFCGEILKRPLHHGPTKGGRKEKDKFHDWYAKTLASYELLFVEEPPKDVWPPINKRFSKASRIKQISTHTHWVIPKPRFLVDSKWPFYLGFSLLPLSMVMIIGLLLGNTSTPNSDSGFSIYEWRWGIFILFSIIILTLWLGVRGKNKSDHNIDPKVEESSSRSWGWGWFFGFGGEGSSDGDDDGGCGGCGCG